MIISVRERGLRIAVISASENATEVLGSADVLGPPGAAASGASCGWTERGSGRSSPPRGADIVVGDIDEKIPA